MWKMIIGEAIFQIAVNLILLYLAPQIFQMQGTPDDIYNAKRTVVFNVFVFMQVFNEFNSRRVDDNIHILRGILKHHIFIAIFVITVIVQFIVCQFGGAAFQTVELNWYEWLGCLGIAFLSVPLAVIIRLIPVCCTLKSSEPEPEYVTREKLLWENAIQNVRTQLLVVRTFRRGRERKQ